ncbi:unnamed protein product [Pylaiella littoralis]
MTHLLDSAYLLASVCVSSALQLISRTIRVRPLIHKVVKVLDRGKAKVPPGLAHIDPWDTLSELVVRVNALNPGMHTLQGTNCYLVGKGPRRILVDTGEGIDGFVGHLLDVMREVGCQTLDAILLTHWHADHTGGVNDVLKALGGDIPVFKWPSSTAESFEYTGVEDGQLFRTNGATLEAMYTPGHTVDHVAFVIHEEKALITGDLILGCGTAIFEDFTSYMASLQRVLTMSPKYDGGFTRLYCGHGPVVDAAEEKIKYYINHRQQRETQITQELTAAEGRYLSSFQITLRVYGFLPIPILVSAHYNVLHHLSKLVNEGTVTAGLLPCAYYVAPERRPKLRGARD